MADYFKYTRVTDDEAINADGTLKDGHCIRVSMRDAQQARDQQLSDADRYVLADQQWRERTRANRPGFRYDVSDAGKHGVKLLGTLMTSVNARWSKHGGSLGGPNTKFRGAAGTGQRGSREGDICSINGVAGHLRYSENGELYCRTDGIDDLDKNSPEEAISDARVNSYADYDAYISNCYKTLR